MVPAFFWAMIILVGALVIKSNKNRQGDYKYFMPNILAKMFFGVAYGVFYLFVYGGGDTSAYFDAAVTLNNLFFKSPELYFEQLLSAPNHFQFTTFYDSTTGYPPGWIFREPEGFFVSKIISVLSFFTLKSYFAMTFILATFTAHASWKLFQLVRSYNFCSERIIAIGILFLPSVNFWCSGISKDSVVFIASMYMIYHSFTIISKEHKTSIINVIMVMLMAFIIFHIRSFVLVAIIIPLFFSISARIVRILGGGNMAVIAFRTIILGSSIVFLGSTIVLQSEKDFISSTSVLQQASSIQHDFQNNDTYGNKKYDLGDIEFTSIGLIKVMPIAVLTGMYRPFIWEALSATLILNGIESLVLLYLTFLFFRKGFLKKWRLIRSHEFLIFSIIFILIIAFMTGMTSVLYGVLVRLRSPLLPFLVILLTVDYTKFSSSESKANKALENAE